MLIFLSSFIYFFFFEALVPIVKNLAFKCELVESSAVAIQSINLKIVATAEAHEFLSYLENKRKLTTG